MTTYPTWEEAYVAAQALANETGLDVALRKTKPFGRVAFVVSFASRNDSDYAKAEIVVPTRHA